MYPGKWAELFPDKPAVINSETEETLTFKQLEDRSNQLSHYFEQNNIKKGSHVVIFSDNDIKFFEIAWAALRSGIYLSPVNHYLKADELSYVINNSGAEAIICSKDLEINCLEALKSVDKKIKKISFNGDIYGFENYESVIEDLPSSPREKQPRGSLMFYSSGTTGKPKGVKWPLPPGEIFEDSEHFLFHQELWGFQDKSVSICTSPLHHAAPAYMALTGHAFGGTVVMMPKFDPEKALEIIQKYRVTHGQWVPTQLLRIYKLKDEIKSKYDLSSLEYVLHAAAPCPVELKNNLLDWMGPVIYEYYSGSEGAGMTHATPEDAMKYPGTVGKALMGIIHVCDEDGKELPIGNIGKIYFESDHEFTYHKDKKKSEEALHENNKTWKSMGDIGYINDEGYLFLTDREKFMIISGGVNIYPQESESIIIVRDDVYDCAVIGVPHDEMGEEVKAMVVLADNIKESEDLKKEIIEYCRSKIAHYKCPKSVDFVSSLPRSETGKLLKRYI